MQRTVKRIYIIVLVVETQRYPCNFFPTSMLGWSYTWEHGRQLASMSSGGTTWSFDYNADGMRYRRSNGSTTYTYYYNGDMLRYLDINGTKLYFVLDASGQPIEVSYKPANSTTTSFYFYVHNLMGDVMAILDTSGNAVVKYTYDAWGNIISTTGSMASTLGQQNPFRYRSYVYDQETGLYYLQSRYYNPTIGRFINADAFISTGQGILGNNVFAYCGNNPVMRKDVDGEYWIYAVEEEKTEVVKEEKDKTRYRTTITYTAFYQPFFCRINYDTEIITYEVPFEYVVTSAGVIKYDNSSDAASHLSVSSVRYSLAEEMYSVATNHVNNALKSRKISGISGELYAHYVAFRFRILEENAIEPFVADRSVDKNADLFEIAFGWLQWFE